VYIERGRIRGRVRHSLISAAGPLTNVAIAFVLMLPFLLGAADSWPPEFLASLAFLALLQVSAAFLNLLPVPGLDGYGIVEPWLSESFKRQVAPYAPFGLIAVFGVLYIQSVNDKFFDAIYHVLNWFHVDPYYAAAGYHLFQFWKN
jgi:Zn-dependent protease